MEYDISLNYVPDIIEESNGNFSVKKEYTVLRHIPNKTRIYGIIIQCVTKTSTVTGSDGKVYNTTDEIKTFTDNNVYFSNDVYFEIFPLSTLKRDIFKDKAVSKYADDFSNNSLVKYTSTSSPHTYNRSDRQYKRYKTKGEITVKGENCFISKNNPNYSTILGMPWTTKDSPANGLQFLPYSPELYTLFFSTFAESNILVHYVTVNWSFLLPKSKVESVIDYHGIPAIVIGGGGTNYRKKNKNKSRKNTAIKYKYKQRYTRYVNTKK